MHDDPLDDAALREVSAGTPFLALIQRSNRPPTAAGIRFLCQQELLTADEAHAVLDHLVRQGIFSEPMSQKRRDLQAALVRAAKARLHLVIDNGNHFSDMPASRSLQAADTGETG
jgi:hypothetical protein